MNDFFNNNRFYPQNFLLSSNSNSDFDNLIKTISENAFAISPDSFNGINKYFEFELRYCAPYEQESFRELKRLQETARRNVRFKKEFNGYIVLNISEWVGHLDEELFSKITMSFLSDMNDSWKYIFISDKQQIPEKDLDILNTYIRVKKIEISDEMQQTDYYTSFFTSLAEECKIRLSHCAQKIFRKLVPEKTLSDKVMSNVILRDISSYFENQAQVDTKMIVAYFTDSNSLCYSLIPKSDIEKITRELKAGQRL